TLSHNAGNAARPVVRRHQAVFQVALRLRTDIARAHVGPGAALGFGVADALAGLARRAHRNLKTPVVAAGPIDGKLPEAVMRLDAARAADAGGSGAVLHPGWHLALQPALRRMVAGWIAEAPGPAVAVAVAAGGTGPGIAGPDRETGIVAAAAVEPHLGVGRQGLAQSNSNQRSHRERNATPAWCNASPDMPPAERR